MTTMGIDPGLQGGLATADVLIKMPTTGSGENRRVDAARILGYLIDLKIKKVVIESIQLRGGNSGKANKTIGKNYGIIIAACDIANVKVSVVDPQKWQKAVIPNIKGRENIKDATIKWCLDKEIFLPRLGSTDRSKKYHDGCADARCILEYELLKNLS